MTSRLDRLFVLLEAGSGPATRRAAARQLGEVQKAHPEELHRLLGRLMRYLQSPAWETRVAASQAVEAILSNVPEWNPPPGDGLKEEELDPEVSLRLKCSTFDVDRVLKDGAHLTGSEGREYDMEEEALSTAEANEKLAKQRQQLNHTLGLDVAATLGVDMGTVFTNDDLVLTNKTMPVKMEPEKRPVQELVTLPNSKPLSSREMNLAKRKARQAAFSKQKSRDCEEGSSAPSTPTDEPDRKKVKLEPEELYSDTGLPTPDGAGGWGGWGSARAGWPLERWCGTLRALLFSGAWEARHGAATALRALLRGARAAGAGRRAGLTASQMEEAHQDWLEDMALRLVCVLALDRFGDFVSDQVVAPVRETSAQALGAVLARLSRDRALGVARALRRLAAHAQWEARHGALLACKYLVAARQDLAVESGALQHLISGLSDAAEDVSAVAAAALVPAADTLANTLGPGLKEVVSRLWRLLAEQDELAAPAHAYLALLAALMSIPEAAKLLHPIDLCDVLPRLWPYLAHSTSSVRRATLQTLCTITQPLASVLRQNKKEEKNTEQTNGSESAEQDLLWMPELLQEAMRHVYQRILFEHVHDIQNIAMQVWENLIRYSCLGALLVAACPMLAAWLCAAMAAPRAPVDAALLLQPPAKERRQKQGSLQTDTVPPELRPPQKWYIGGSESQTQSVRERNVMRARVKAADAIGLLSCYLVQPAPGIEYKTKEESPIECYVKVLIVYLRSGSALQRLVCALATAAWARRAKGTTHLKPTSESETETTQVSKDCESNGGINIASETKDCGVNSASETKDVCAVCGSETVAPPSLAEALHSALLQPLYYDELAFSCNKILQEARDLLAMMKHYKLPVDGAEFNNILRLEQVIHMATVTEPMIAAMKLKRVATTLEERRTSVLNAAKQCSVEQATLNVSVQAALAGACAHLHCLPEKLNPVIRPLMESIKKEPSVELQELAAGSLAALLEQLRDREPCPNGKVLHNLKTFLRCDPDVTPRATLCAALSGDEARESGSDSGADTRTPTDNCPQLDQYSGILTLWEYQRAADKLTPKRGRPPALAADLDGVLGGQDESQRQTDIQRRGAALALSELTKRADARLPTLLPPLWEMLSAPLLAPLSDEELENQDVESADSLISRLQVFETVCPALHPALFARLCPPGAGEGAGADAAGGLLALVRLTRHKRTAVRHMAARCLAAAVAKQPELAPILADELLPQLASLSHARGRCGAAEALARVVAALQLAIVPYIALLVVPLLGRMSDPCPSVRVMSTRCFATLVQLMPLDGAVAEPRGLSPALRARRDRDKAFLARLFRPAAIEDYAVPVPVAATLRSYQQAGVNWLRFLYEYQLHGVLCDDMGLGKTLQCICVVAGAHWEQRGAGPLPSLVVCPPTLTGHWVFEVNKFIPSNYLKPLQYVGPPAERERLRSQVRFYNLIVASYDIVRKDIDFFSKLRWNYCILDEGHVIKNGKTKAFKAIKQIIANHRLILSGTPIQNNVLELWSLFDFLMPGLLGSERQFTAQYSRPILAARDARATPHQLQAGALACEALHRQVLPFLLRRVKEDVLKELPPKITQDYYCELSPLQRRLYDGLALPGGDAGAAAAGHAHVFQALHYLQNVCNHPKLVLKPAHPEAAAVARQMTAEGGSLDDIHHAAKLPALKQLLLDCGIGTIDSSKDTEAPVVSQHRALIFCQLKKMLDIVEHDLLKRHLPSVSYLRLDGSVPAGARHAVVDRFNTDPSIDVLLLTTQVGGLGLNLTGADTVIFVEHDWNPMKDLQAMDRAHRIGQRRVVNVYRLVTRGTLEEKIMGLQKFKLQTANTVISSENAAMETMGTEQLLDIVQQCRGGVGLGAGPAGTSSVLDCLPELWEQSQYEEEYDMGSFLEGLRRGQGE